MNEKKIRIFTCFFVLKKKAFIINFPINYKINTKKKTINFIKLNIVSFIFYF